MNFTGGLHHAMRGKASGFCVYNDIAVGIQWLLDHGAERVAYVDVDVHHGDGVERIFWDDPRVLTISVHETGRALFPGTGWPSDVGGPDAEGTAVNVALPPGLSDAGWLRAIHAVGDATGPRVQARRARRPSTAATPTSRTRWPTSPSPSTPSAPRPTPSTGSRTRCARAAGWHSAAGGTRSSTSCRARGRT